VQQNRAARQGRVIKTEWTVGSAFFALLGISLWVFTPNEHFVHSLVTPTGRGVAQKNLRKISELSQDFLVGSRYLAADVRKRTMEMHGL
jgi:hypothetical protein